MKKNVNSSTSTSLQLPKQTRHIVTWSQEEDDVLRHQIRDHGTDNWAIIASKFKDKTTRQCRRRWYTYLNSDFKKGGWSPEEDMLLCEAQKIFGNRWTEIAKVVSGRTDNAVKNRFNTLCKKRAKAEALAKENSTSFINLNNKRILFQNLSSADGLSETGGPFKKIRRNHITDIAESCVRGEKLEGECGKTNVQLRSPFAVIVRNFDILRDLPTGSYDNTITLAKDEGASEDMIEGMYLKKDDPKIIALMQQTQLLSSLALKVNTENTDQSLENAWKTLQDFLNQSKEGDVIRFRVSDMDHQLENSIHLAEDINSCKEGSRGSWRQSDLYADSPDSSEYSTGSTIINHLSSCDKSTCSEGDACATQQQNDTEAELHPIHTGNSNGHGDVEEKIFSNAITNQSREILNHDVLPCNDLKTDDGTGCAFSNIQFGSPSQLTPLFRTFASGIPTPQFSESEKHFLLKTLGVDSASPSPSTKTLQSPPCKRALLHSL